MAGSAEQQRGVAKNRVPESAWAAARIMYESNPDLMIKEIAEKCGVSVRALQCRIKADGEKGDVWNRKLALDVSEEAQALAERYQGKLEDYGPEITVDQKREAVRQLATERAIDLRAQVIERHQREWGAIRQLMYRSIKENKPWKDDDDSKRAKILAETMQIVQSNERKAWGIDKPSGDTNTAVTVVIERS